MDRGRAAAAVAMLIMIGPGAVFWAFLFPAGWLIGTARQDSKRRKRISLFLKLFSLWGSDDYRVMSESAREVLFFFWNFVCSFSPKRYRVSCAGQQLPPRMLRHL